MARLGPAHSRAFTPVVVGKAILDPHVKHWPGYGWRAEVVIDNNNLGDIRISDWVQTRREAQILALKALADAAEPYH